MKPIVNVRENFEYQNDELPKIGDEKWILYYFVDPDDGSHKYYYGLAKITDIQETDDKGNPILICDFSNVEKEPFDLNASNPDRFFGPIRRISLKGWKKGEFNSRDDIIKRIGALSEMNRIMISLAGGIQLTKI